MSITVVTTRADEGAPTNRDVYALGGSWRTGDSNLEIFSADRKLIALYSSGNWFSVYVDDSMYVLKAGEERPPSSTPAAASTLTPVEDLSVDAVVRAPVAARTTDADDWADGRVDRSAYSQPPQPPPESSREREWPPGMRPVAFRPRTLRAARPDASDPTPDEDEKRFMPVRFRPRTYRAARPDVTPPPEPETRFQPVVFRMKTYRAAREAQQSESEQHGEDETGS